MAYSDFSVSNMIQLSVKNVDTRAKMSIYLVSQEKHSPNDVNRSRLSGLKHGSSGHCQAHKIFEPKMSRHTKPCIGSGNQVAIRWRMQNFHAEANFRALD